ncbi:MAG: hypothetical protein ACYTFN_16510 [Planctomycetota bacterium]
MPALMEEGIPTRRRFIATTVAAAFGAGVVGSVIASWVIVAGREDKKAQERRPELSDEQKLWIAGAKRLAESELDVLVTNYEAVISVIELYGGDEVLWRGAERLATYAVLKRDAYCERLARRLLQTFEFRTPPKSFQRLVPQLTELARKRHD